jgi:hypothetical protein
VDEIQPTETESQNETEEGVTNYKVESSFEGKALTDTPSENIAEEKK